ncbi:TPA: hypothetical protein NGR52_004197 [Vibrio parahaemolyticus]|nr:hypothetical protein [Vibrio parahaemolyticus]
MDARAAMIQNRQYERAINAALSTVIYDVSVPAVTMTLRETVMQTWHDSSNAAFNWYVISDRHPTPPYQEFKGHDPVGSEGDKRSATGQKTAKDLVAHRVMLRELPKIKEVYTSRAPIDLSFYNAVQDSPDHPYYSNNAEIYRPLHDPQVTVTFEKVSATKFEEWKGKYGF